ncbi:MAG: PD-(D/E)XK motif protein [Chitinophagaceae bacterium]|nr:MAG: PD-(D/E)XK motif protein [Chitinophagaceae bacterium]
MTDPAQYTNEFIQVFYKWSEFFEDRKNSRLSDEEVKGLYGELFVLKSMVEVSASDSERPEAMYAIGSMKLWRMWKFLGLDSSLRSLCYIVSDCIRTPPHPLRQSRRLDSP